VSVTVTVTAAFWPNASLTAIVQTPAAAPAVTVNVALAAAAVGGLTVATELAPDAHDALSAIALKLPAYPGSATVNVAV
jgi:hypothetical protein